VTRQPRSLAHTFGPDCYVLKELYVLNEQARFLFVRCLFLISARTSVLTEAFHGFCQSLQVDAEMLLRLHHDHILPRHF
jgi:hypothetical protein